MGNDRQVAIHHDAIGSALVSGDGNTVYIYHYHLDAQTSVAIPPAAVNTSTPIGANPYRGLAAFQVEDAEVYFGREVQVERLWNRLRELDERSGQADAPPRLLPILGPSGSGKSSLARAGLLPELARHPLLGYRQPRVVVMTPGSTPLESLGVVLARIATGDVSPVEKAAEFERVLRRPNDEGKQDGLRRIANALPSVESSPLVVLIDQFEEVYSLCKSPSDRAAFIDGLIEAATAVEGRVLVVITLRSDFLGETQRHPRLNEIIGSEQVVVVPAMNEAELRRAIAEPAKQAGKPLDEATIDLLIAQTEGREGALPLLQFALTRIWEGIAVGKAPAETLRTIGGVGGALAGEAQRIYDSLITKEQDVARRLFIGVVELGEGTKDTRRRATVESLMSALDDPNLVRTVIGRFSATGARLLTLLSAEGKEVVEVTHEALFDHWQQLQAWLNGQRDLIRQQRRINTLAEEWSKQGKKRDYLVHGRQLNDARAFHKKYADILPLSRAAVELLHKSFRQQWVNRFMVASLAVIPLMVIEGFLREEAIKRDYATLQGADLGKKPQAVSALSTGCSYVEEWPKLPYPLRARIFGNCRSLANLDLSKVDLSGANLRIADLNGADLSNADLRIADLNGADLRIANLTGADLSNADLGEANLSGADLSNANLREANLSRTDIRGASLSRVGLTGASLRGASLSEVDLTGAHLTGADFVGASLSEVDLTGAHLSEADFTGASLSGSDFSRANLVGAHLNEADLSGANLSESNLTGADLSEADLSGANLSEADFRITRGWSTEQIGQASLCKTKLPEGASIDPNRDCDALGIVPES